MTQRDAAFFGFARRSWPFALSEEIEPQTGARARDLADVFNLQNGKSSPAIFADTGPADRIGEGSIALAERLGFGPPCEVAVQQGEFCT
jgi:hypothetical protein